jgi:manganese transport protein
MAAGSSSPALSLEEVHGSVRIPKSPWRRLLAFAGPAFLVSVGYMDPGNWATDIEAGSKFDHRLVWVLLMSNLMAVLLQSLAARLGVVTGRDLAQACRESYPRRAVWALWGLAEIAIAATDLAEVIGIVIALNLLFGLPYLWGLLLAGCDTLLLLALQRRGVRLLELLTLLLIGVIAVSFVVEIALARPDWAAVAGGFVPGLARGGQATESLYIAIAMLGATVMPHNLYLHSALVQTRAFPQTDDGKRQALKYNLLDSLLALNGAFFVNLAILILAATRFTEPVKSLTAAHDLLKGVWGATLASILFAVALLASGQSSTLTGTLAGQVVMEGFVRLRVRPWARRLVTRLLALVPALLVIAFAGREADVRGESAQAYADERLLQLLVLSQAVLSFQLPFAIVPLVQFTGDGRRMGRYANGRWLKGLAWACAALVVGLNAALVGMSMSDWAGDLAEAGVSPWWAYGPAGPVALALAAFLAWLTLYPRWVRRGEAPASAPAPVLPAVRYDRIGVAVEFDGADDAVLAQASALARSHGAELIVVHVVEGPAAQTYGSEADDRESREDRQRMAALLEHLRDAGLRARGALGYGVPAEQLARIARDNGFDLLVLGSHGHRFLADMALGRTVTPLLHRLTIPVLVVPTRGKAETQQAHGSSPAGLPS